jgi:hypothetical protein
MIKSVQYNMPITRYELLQEYQKNMKALFLI